MVDAVALDDIDALDALSVETNKRELSHKIQHQYGPRPKSFNTNNVTAGLSETHPLQTDHEVQQTCGEDTQKTSLEQKAASEPNNSAP